MAYPQIGDKFDSVTELRLACHRAALADRVRLVVRRSEPNLQELICNALGYGSASSCTMRFKFKLASNRWVVQEACTLHSHNFTERDRITAADRTAASIENLEAERSSAKRRDQDDEDDSDLSDSCSTSVARDPGTSHSTSISPRKSSTRALFPSVRDLEADIAELTSRQSTILPFPHAKMSFPTSRDLLIYVHASSRQHDFHLFRSSPSYTRLQLYCRLGHTQTKHRPLCRARYRFDQGSDGRWRIIQDTFTGHTHVTRDDYGRSIPAENGGSMDEQKGSRPAAPSKKRPRLSEPKALPPPLSFSSRLTHSASMSHLTSLNDMDRLKPSPPASSRPSPSSSSSARHPPPLQPKLGMPSPPPLNTTFLLTLSTFLASLNPRLSALASPLLHQARLDSLDRTVHWLSLSDEVQGLVLRDLKGVGLIERHLLKKELKRARDGGWIAEGALKSEQGSL